MKNKNLKNKKAFSLIELSIVILIVGVIVAGVTQSSRLIGAFKLNSARNLTQSSPVASIKDLAVWVESTSEKSFDESDQDDELAIDNWYDINPQSTSKINFTQATSGYRPSYEVNGINNLPTVQFDGSDDSFGLATTQTLGNVTSSDQMTIFLVHKMLVAKDTNSFYIDATANSAIRISSHFPAVGNTTYYFDYSTCCVTNVSRVQPSFSASYFNRTNIVMWRIKSAVATVRMNGAQILSNAMTGTFTASDLANNINFILGSVSYSGGSNYYLNGYMGEFIMFRRGLNSDEIADVERYLSKKWGVSI